MAGKGPPKTPTKILQMRGSQLARKRTAEPVPVSQALPCPAWLDADGKKVWKALVRHLKALGVVGAIDAFAVGRYCQLWCRWVDAEQQIRAHGSMAPTLDAEGAVTGWRIAAAVKIAGDLADKLLRLEQQYGMTASARASLSVVSPAKASQSATGADKTRFFKQRAQG